MNSTEKRKYAEEILQNPIFYDTLEKMKSDAISSMLNLKWDAEGDALRRKAVLEIELIEGIISKFKFMVNLDQSKVGKSTKHKGVAT